MEGPTNAPRANVDVQSPEIRPYVSRLLGKPCSLKTFLVQNFALNNGDILWWGRKEFCKQSKGVQILEELTVLSVHCFVQ
jgi:hypothetical protein